MMQTKLTRNDCTRDDVRVPCPGAIMLGHSIRYCKSGKWLAYEYDNHRFVGRAICRVICEGQVYIEVAQASDAFSHTYIRWIDPANVREVRPSPPRAVFEFFSMAKADWKLANIFQKLEYGVSDMRDQIGAREDDRC